MQIVWFLYDREASYIFSHICGLLPERQLFGYFFVHSVGPFSALTLLVGQQEGHPACKKTEWWVAGMVICLEQGADLHIAQLMPLPLNVSCSSKIQTGFTFLVLSHLGSPRQQAVKRVRVCVNNLCTA